MTFIALIILGSITILANLAEKDKNYRPLVIASVMGLCGLVLLNEMMETALAFFPSDDPERSLDMTFKPENSVASFVIVFICCGVAVLLMWQPFREWIAGLFPKAAPLEYDPFEEAFPMIMLNQGAVEFSEAQSDHAVARSIDPIMPDVLGFRPQSIMHAWAAALAVIVFGSQLSAFVQAGGLAGIADDIAVDYGSLISQFLIIVLIPILGVGAFMRRDLHATLQRLGLTSLDWKAFLISLVISAGLLVTLFMIVGMWIAVVGEDTFNEQNEASSALSESINTLGLAFMVAFTAAVGEEIAFRGALQPIFGLWWTAIIFTLIHIQYTLTPATLIIFVVALVLGYVRRYLNTSAAIIVHFSYNFVQLLLAVAASQIEQFIRFL